MSKVTQVIITDTFASKYHKFWGKQQIPIQEFVDSIVQDIDSNIRYLDRPYIKLKANIGHKNLRVLANYQDSILVLMPIFISDKNDKQRGENMIRSSMKQRASHLIQKIEHDIELDQFTIYYT